MGGVHVIAVLKMRRTDSVVVVQLLWCFRAAKISSPDVYYPFHGPVKNKDVAAKPRSSQGRIQ